MPLPGFESLCKDERQKIIVSGENKLEHRAVNADGSRVTHYRIDGVVITEGKKCDFLVINEDKRTAYLIELKAVGGVRAAEQLKTTAQTLGSSSRPIRFITGSSFAMTQQPAYISPST